MNSPKAASSSVLGVVGFRTDASNFASISCLRLQIGLTIALDDLLKVESTGDHPGGEMRVCPITQRSEVRHEMPDRPRFTHGARIPTLIRFVADELDKRLRLVTGHLLDIHHVGPLRCRRR